MIYSENINKICGLCVNAKRVKGSETHMMCSVKGEYVSVNHEACDRFGYDIFKRPVRRRKKNTSGKFKPEDFQL